MAELGSNSATRWAGSNASKLVAATPISCVPYSRHAHQIVVFCYQPTTQNYYVHNSMSHACSQDRLSRMLRMLGSRVEV